MESGSTILSTAKSSKSTRSISQRLLAVVIPQEISIQKVAVKPIVVPKTNKKG